MAPRPGTGPGDRLGATLALSAILFGVLILGVGFALDPPAPVAPTLDVILTETRSETPPEDADFIAQANNQGGGESERAERPREEQLAPVPKPEPGEAPEPMVAQAPPPEPEPVPRLLSTIGPSDQVLPAPEDQRETETEPLPTGQELVEQSLTLAKLANSIAKSAERKPGSYPAELAQVCHWPDLHSATHQELLAATVVGDIWGVGRKLSVQLNQVGICTALDLAKADPVTVQRRWSIVLAKTVRELNGTPCLTLDDIPPDKQQIACTRSFGHPVTELHDLIEAITEFTSRAAEKIAQARFAVYGTNQYPDATFSLRLSYGRVEGWTYRGVTVPAFTCALRARAKL